MSVAVSGPARKLTEEEFGIVRAEIAKLPPGTHLFSGGAHGVDTAAAFFALELGLPVVLVVPADLFHNYRLAQNTELADVIEVEGSYMDRNDRLAEEADELIAFPRSPNETVRSGTWATVRRFRKQEKPVKIVSLS